MTTPLYPAAALSMALGVACGAFGAHALKDAVPATDLIIWEKSVHYHLIHSLSTLIVLVTPTTIVPQKRSRLVALLFLIGTLIFSGSLYTLVLTNQRWLGMITPLGGTCFIAGWLTLSLAAALARSRHSEQSETGALPNSN